MKTTLIAGAVLAIASAASHAANVLVVLSDANQLDLKDGGKSGRYEAKL